MFDPSKPLRPGAISEYLKKDYSLASNSYFTQGKQIEGHWSGQLAEEIGLTGTVTTEAFDRLANGQNPFTGEQLIEHKETNTAKARAGWDLTVNAPKTVSLAALVGGDHRILEAHRAANAAALEKMQEYVQQRMGGRNAAVTTGKWIVASFEHNTARPDANGYPAPHLHTHNVLFNMTATDGNAQARAVQEREIFRAQKLGTAVYQAELGWRLQQLGYSVKRGTNNAPDIKDFTKEYLDNESPRTREIKQRAEELGLSGRRAEKLIAHQDRNEKLDITSEELKIIHQANAELFGNQPARIVEEARLNRGTFHRSAEDLTREAYRAVEYARKKLSERSAVFDEHEVLRHALQYRPGSVRLQDVEQALKQHRAEEKLVDVSHVRPNSPGHRFTTREMLEMEKEIVAWGIRGRETVQPIAPEEELGRFDKLKTNELRRQVLLGYLRTEDQVTLMRGGAGTGKTTSMGMLTEIAREQGYKVVGVAPVSKAVAAMRKEGIDAQTLQKFIKRKDPADDRKRLLLLDEASLVSTRTLHAFMQRVRPQDHVILMGDARQHAAVEAGSVFEQLQQAGLKMAELNRNYRQQTEDLKSAINLMAADRIPDALKMLDKHGRIEEQLSKHDRYARIAAEYALQPQGTIVVSPDNNSRRELNGIIRDELKRQDLVAEDKLTAQVLVGRDVHQEDRKLAEIYRPGDVVQFHQAHKDLGIKAKAQATVTAVNPAMNEVTVELGRKTLTYDPRRAYGVSLFETKDIALAIGDRIQFTAPWKQHANRDMGTIAELDRKGNIRLELDEGGTVEWNLRENRAIDYAYAFTSHSVQGATVDRALINIETLNSHVDGLLNKSFAYVASSRPRYELKLFVDSKAELEHKLDRGYQKFKALSVEDLAEHVRKVGMDLQGEEIGYRVA
jgi:conjugative relaxase-like TrwC/TraI family protein